MCRNQTTYLPCGEQAYDISDYSSYVFYVGKSCMNTYGSVYCKSCKKYNTYEEHS